MEEDGRQRSSRQGEPLSKRELEVLRLAVSGIGNRQVAAALGLSRATVKRHLANIYSKLGVTSRVEAFSKGLVEGWLTAEDILRLKTGEWEEAATRYRCTAEGCGREVVVVRASRTTGSVPPIECHGCPMASVVP